MKLICKKDYRDRIKIGKEYDWHYNQDKSIIYVEEYLFANTDNPDEPAYNCPIWMYFYTKKEQRKQKLEKLCLIQEIK